MAHCIILSGGTYNPDDTSKIQRSLGPYRLATALQDAGFTAFVLDFCIEFSTDEIIAVLEQQLGEDTLWVGFSSTFYFRNNKTTDARERMYYNSYDQVQPVIDYIRANSSAKIVYGGSSTVYYGGRDANVDYYVAGYADVSVVDLTQHLADGSTTPPFEILDVDGVPATILDSFKYPDPAMDQLATHWNTDNFNILPGEGLPIELARGCIFKCKFCSYPLLGKKKGTYLRDPAQVRDELIEAWEANGTTNFYITDDTFNDDNDKIEALHRVFTSLPFKPNFACYLRVDLINRYPHQAQLLQEMGLIGTYFGLETANADSARVVGKGLDPVRVRDRLYWLEEQWGGRVNIEAGFILGLPYDTEAYFKELFAWCQQADNPIDYIAFYPLYLFRYASVATPENLKRLERYLSEFSFNPEIYGYEFPGTNNISDWTLPSQTLDSRLCKQYADRFTAAINPRNKISGFSMISHLNLGIKLDDLFNLTVDQVRQQYNIPELNRIQLAQYKQLVSKPCAAYS